MKKPTGEPGWSWRRAAIFPVVAWGCWELHLLKAAADTRVNETIAFGWITLIAALVLGYTGFATAQDIAAIWRTRSGLPYAPTPAGFPAESTTSEEYLPVKDRL